MPNIYETEFRRADLNLIVTFFALMEERSVTRAAHKLLLSQAAVSAALGRLRTLFDDPLLIRAAGQMRPTPRALQLERDLSPALAIMHSTIVGLDSFDPAEGRPRFILGVSDDIEAAVLPGVIRRLRRDHPNVSIVTRQTNQHVVGEQLERDEIDLAIVATPRTAPEHEGEILFASSYSCLYDGARLGLSSPLTLDDFISTPHLLVSYSGTRGAVDDALEPQGLARTVIASSTHFSSLMVMLKAVDAIATIPTHAAHAFADVTGLTVSAPPIPMAEYTVSVLWSRRRSHDARLRWLRALLRQQAPAPSAPRRPDTATS
ncbi:LysR family transcriptional activator of mexEF-oprN operon [Microbacterium sp. SORGH_AS 1204]|uniref:LysR family transcriptional regulator n=1 Tax=Microbacterium sp. SORGH_AS_1204 TaxID=3041785 RepID=UPI0027918B7A|nr:LysR family transcriptional regulator [Microbacterium sp. SORGH_AS_1204]MDQ1138164.1 LysR family transcriptional activator of mexEF-oprN operon [Microbacterium sp. SORGH_AS_1204]